MASNAAEWVGSAYLFIQSDHISLPSQYTHHKPLVYRALGSALSDSAGGSRTPIEILKIHSSDLQLILYLRFCGREPCRAFLRDYRQGRTHQNFQRHLDSCLSPAPVPICLELKVGTVMLDAILEDEERCLEHIASKRPSHQKDDEFAEMDQVFKKMTLGHHPPSDTTFSAERPSLPSPSCTSHAESTSLPSPSCTSHVERPSLPTPSCTSPAERPSLPSPSCTSHAERPSLPSPSCTSHAESTSLPTPSCTSPAERPSMPSPAERTSPPHTLHSYGNSQPPESTLPFQGQDFADRLLSFQDHQYFARSVGKRWKQVGRSLSTSCRALRDPAIDNLAFEYDKEGLYEQAYQMLRRFIDCEGTRATLKRLVTALEDNGLNNIAGELLRSQENGLE
ncbi:tumor necrosis factor receptor type 1-associated DEATH domain protein [Ascaphus truei]|uniref:tumor necrosis factor receptor type 1-associated DEATH domain protein n=1 Tax=Ascaphus truei TaxID=8439 RepID=UPI003F5A381F